MSSNEGSGSKSPDGRGPSMGRRHGRNTTFEAPAYDGDEDELEPIRPQDLMEPDGTGAAIEGEAGFFQATAMFDKGQFLGELAELVEGAPETRAAVEAEVAPPQGCRLIIVAGPEIGLEWAFKNTEIVIGRDEECELVLSDIAVSRQHAKIVLQGTHFVLQDLGSGNGTYLNGARVEREELSPGDEITIGERTMRFVELNESPPTAAAHPVPPGLPAEPEVGGVSGIIDPAENRLGRRSQVDVGVVPEADGPAVDVSTGTKRAKDASVPEQGRTLRITLTALGSLVLLAALTTGVVMYRRHLSDSKIQAQREKIARTQFLQGIELTKLHRFGDAALLFERVLSVIPSHTRAAEYKEHCMKEVAEWRDLEAARALAKAGRFSQAIEALREVDASSVYAKDAKRLRTQYARTIARDILIEARSRLAANDLEGARTLIARALEQAPGFEDALKLAAEIDEIERARRDAKKPVVPSFVVPPELLRAVALYRNGMIGAAIDAAEAAGGANASTWVARMKRSKNLLAEAATAHQKKAAAELLRIAPAALEVDKQIAGGDGKVRERLRGYYADGLYLKGIEAYQEGDDVRAFQLLSEAQRVQPGHKLAATRLSELDRKARDVYFEGYVTQDSDKEKTRKAYRRLLKMTSSANQYHRMAAKWLKENGG